ncbi:Trp operon leader peptide, partial [Vibrio fluvialis]|nr:Trp operon leader peptide [Vibrio fluvialis]
MLQEFNSNHNPNLSTASAEL